jgi:hypothetical protein
VVHSLFKEYHSCARSFSLLLLPALSLSRLARLKRLKTPLLPLPTLPPKLLLTLRLLLPTLLLLLPTLLAPPPTLLLLLRALPTLLLALLKKPPRRCNLRLRAKIRGAQGQPCAPLSFVPAARA